MGEWGEEEVVDNCLPTAGVKGRGLAKVLREGMEVLHQMPVN